MIYSIGKHCLPVDPWEACGFAMNIIPTFLSTGILAVIAGVVILIWSIAFVQRKYGGLVLILLSI